jgi:hypothetical protein
MISFMSQVEHQVLCLYRQQRRQYPQAQAQEERAPPDHHSLDTATKDDGLLYQVYLLLLVHQVCFKG